MVIAFEHLSGSRAGQQESFSEDRIRVGRHPENELAFDPQLDLAVSKFHAEVIQEPGGVVLVDLGSSNGTLRNGRKVERCKVMDGDILQFGEGGPLVRTLIRQAPPSGKTTSLRTLVVLAAQAGRKVRVAVAISVISGAVAMGAMALLGWWFLSSSPPSQRIASSVSRGIYMLIARKGSTETGVCTAFAVRDRGVLATNAHCVRAMQAMAKRSRTYFIARMNGDARYSYTVKQWVVHPAYRGDAFSPDVGLVSMDLQKGRLPVALPLAAPSALLGLSPGQSVYTLAFPGKIMNTQSPNATFNSGTIGRLTDLSNGSAAPESSIIVWHNLWTSKGTSGSPVINDHGEVVAVNSGGLGAKSVLALDPSTGKMKSEVVYSATGLNFAIRVDMLKELMAAFPDL